MVWVGILINYYKEIKKVFICNEIAKFVQQCNVLNLALKNF